MAVISKNFRLLLAGLGGLTVGGLVVLSLFLVLSPTKPTPTPLTATLITPSSGDFNPNFPQPFTSKLPADVNTDLRKKFLEQNKLAELHRLYNIYSWQSFLALNWPTDDKGTPALKITDKGSPLWSHWKEHYEVFKDDGSKPSPWDSPRDIKDAPLSKHPPVDSASKQNKNIRLPFLTKAAFKPKPEESDQAFTGPLYDQNGELVYYEIVLNREEFDYLVQNKLYNLDGQIAFSKQTPSITPTPSSIPSITPSSIPSNTANFPGGKYGTDKVGSIEVKLAWKVLNPDKGDLPCRFFSTQGSVLNPVSNKWESKQLGLVGFHISQKTETASQWVWSTFEHVDNLQVNEFGGGCPGSNKIYQLKPSFYNQQCPSCPVNIDPNPPTPIPTTPSTITPSTITPSTPLPTPTPTFPPYPPGIKVPPYHTQVQRLIPIPESTQDLNRQVQAMLAESGSVWQYYELIDTQYPLDQTAPPSKPKNDGKGLPDSINNKSGGKPNIAYLTNMVMETYFQLGNQPVGKLEQDGTGTTIVFGTEGCMGCHSSAGIANDIDTSTGKKIPKFNGQLSADFSWLLQLKACWDNPNYKPGQDCQAL